MISLLTCGILVELSRAVVLLDERVEGTFLHIHALVPVGVDEVLVDVRPPTDIGLVRQVLAPLIG